MGFKSGSTKQLASHRAYQDKAGAVGKTPVAKYGTVLGLSSAAKTSVNFYTSAALTKNLYGKQLVRDARSVGSGLNETHLAGRRSHIAYGKASLDLSKQGASRANQKPSMVTSNQAYLTWIQPKMQQN